MHRTNSVDSKSRSPKEHRLKKNKTEKDLHHYENVECKKLSFLRSSSNKNLQLPHSKSYDIFFRPQKLKTDTPKWVMHSKRPIPRQPTNLRTETQLRKIQKEIQVEKPKILKQKNDSYSQLQVKLRSLQGKLEQLKLTLARNEPRNHTKSKSKKSRSLAKRGNSIEQEKNDSMMMPSQVLNNYVTQVRPTKKVPIQTDTLSTKMKMPYYLGHLSKHQKHREDCPVYEHILQSVKTINFMKKITKPQEIQIQRKKVVLKVHNRNQNRKTVIFDLDETLIHCNQTESKYDVKLPITFPNGQVIAAGINIRPFARQVLQSLSKAFEVIVFTASHSCYANTVIDYLDPNRKYISHRLFRQHCYETDSGMYIKDLRVIRNRQLSHMVLVDNAAYSYFFQLDNGIPVIPFYSNKKDSELLSLQSFLMKQILQAQDVRDVLRDKFKLHRYADYNDTSKMIESIYL